MAGEPGTVDGALAALARGDRVTWEELLLLLADFAQRMVALEQTAPTPECPQCDIPPSAEVAALAICEGALTGLSAGEIQQVVKWLMSKHEPPLLVVENMPDGFCGCSHMRSRHVMGNLQCTAPVLGAPCLCTEFRMAPK